MDAPFHLDSDYKPTFKETIARLSIINDDGIEVETQEIDNGYFVHDEIQQGKLSYKSFEKRADLVSEKNIRGKGMIIETDSTGREHQYYDNGKWDLTSGGMASIGTLDGDKPSVAMSVYNANEQKLVKKYPHLQSSAEKRRQELMTQIDTRTLSLISENLTLKSNNEKLQGMLQKALTFAQTVRDSRVGKIFFGKKAKEVLGEQDKRAKQLPDGR